MNGAFYLEEIAPPRFVKIREGRRALEGEGLADGVGVRVVQLCRGLAERLALRTSKRRESEPLASANLCTCEDIGSMFHGPSTLAYTISV